jgi:ribonuclease HII
MGVFIGTDEAGYGPNLGPLVITASVWEVPGDPREFDFFTALNSSITQQAGKGDQRLHVADSKAVYAPGKGIDSLERSVLSLIRLNGWNPASFQQFCAELSRHLTDRRPLSTEPWYAQADLPLPQKADTESMQAAAKSLLDGCRTAGIRLLELRSEIISPERFNALCEMHGNKATALSQTTLGLIRSVWNPDSDEATLIVGDKHGGRNRYDELIDQQLDGQMILRLGEGRERSTYRVGSTELRFQMRAESHFPVAVSSMVCKYVRELAMELFNQFWQQHQPGLKPTKGYPVDAKRFREDIASTQQALSISDRILWRNR